MKKFGRIFIISAIVSSLVISPVYADPTVDDLKQEKAAVESQVSSLQAELTDLIAKISTLEANLIAKGQEIAQATEDLAVAEEKEKQQYDDMKLRIKYMYEEGNSSFFETLLAAEDFSDFLNKAEYIQNVNTYDRDMLNAYAETKDEVKTLKGTLEEEAQQMTAMQEEYQQEEADLNHTLTTKQAEIANFDAEIQAAAEAAARALEEQRKAEEEAAAAQNNDQQGGNSQNNNAADNTTGNDSTQNNNNNQQNDTGNSGSGSVDPGGNTGKANAIVSAAYGYLGVPYAWGGASRSGVDCSGLVMLAHRAAGISLAHSSGSQGGGGQRVTNPQPGDVVCYSGHVGIYIGGNQMIHAPQPGEVVRVQRIYGSPWYRRYW